MQNDNHVRNQLGKLIGILLGCLVMHIAVAQNAIVLSLDRTILLGNLVSVRQLVGGFPGQKRLFIGVLGVSQLPSGAIAQLDLESDACAVLSRHHEALQLSVGY